MSPTLEGIKAHSLMVELPLDKRVEKVRFLLRCYLLLITKKNVINKYILKSQPMVDLGQDSSLPKLFHSAVFSAGVFRKDIVA